MPHGSLDQCKLLSSLELMSLAARTLLTVVLLSTTFPAVAQAQIYLTRDSAGNFVLSDKPNNPTALLKTYAVPEAETFRTTRGIVSERAARYEALIKENAAIHDVSPLTRDVVAQMLHDLTKMGVDRVPLLVIPNHHKMAPISIRGRVR